MSLRYRVRSAPVVLLAWFIPFNACNSNVCESDSVDGGGIGALGEQLAINGQIGNWQYGSGFTLQATFAQSMNPLATAPIDAAGNFNISLPNGRLIFANFSAEHHDATQMGQSCNGCIKIDPQDYMMIELTLSAIDDAGLRTFSITHGSGTPPSFVYTNVRYWYVVRDVNQRGVLDCVGSGALARHSIIDTRYQQGWNTVVYNSSLEGNLQTTTTFTGPPLSGLKWMATSTGL